MTENKSGITETSESNFFSEFWKNYFNYTGFMSRKNYWLAVIVNYILLCIFLSTILGLVIGVQSIASILAIIIFLGGLVSATARRIRDAGFPWAFNLLWLGFPTIVPIIVLLVLAAFPSKGNNYKAKTNTSNKLNGDCEIIESSIKFEYMNEPQIIYGSTSSKEEVKHPENDINANDQLGTSIKGLGSKKKRRKIIIMLVFLILTCAILGYLYYLENEELFIVKYGHFGNETVGKVLEGGMESVKWHVNKPIEGEKYCDVYVEGSYKPSFKSSFKYSYYNDVWLNYHVNVEDKTFVLLHVSMDGKSISTYKFLEDVYLTYQIKGN